MHVKLERFAILQASDQARNRTVLRTISSRGRATLGSPSRIQVGYIWAYGWVGRRHGGLNMYTLNHLHGCSPGAAIIARPCRCAADIPVVDFAHRIEESCRLYHQDQSPAAGVLMPHMPRIQNRFMKSTVDNNIMGNQTEKARCHTHCRVFTCCQAVHF